MANPIPAVSFPLFGGASTAIIRDRLPLRLVNLSGCTIDGRWSATDRAAPLWRLYLNLDEGAEVVVRGRSTALRTGRIHLIPAWLHWSSRCRGRVRHFNALFEVPGLLRERIAATCTAVVQVAGADDALTGEGLALARDLAVVERAGVTLLARGHALVWSAFARYLAGLGARADGLLLPERDRGIETLRQWVGERLDQPLPRAALARAAACSEAELARRFAANAGTSPMRWLRDLRVARAADLLRSTTLSIEDVAARTGLGDRSRFSKVFARLVGNGPAAFRRRG